MEKILGVIPARGGSKGVPRKNIKDLNGKPLIAYTIEAAIKSKLFDKIIVSTDDVEIARIAGEYGAEIPFLRPAEISGDDVSSDDVVLHALDYYKKKNIYFDKVCKLQPTSPLRTANHLIEANQLMENQKANFIVSVCECEHSPKWAGIIGKDLRLDNFIENKNKRACRQQIEKYYRLNGALYIGKVEEYKKERNFLGTNSIAYVMSQEDSIDIDSMLDFTIAETVMKVKCNSELLP